MTLNEGDVLVGRYKLVSKRGNGSFGEVWQAWDEMLGMEVALKIYISLDDRGVDEFKSEYRTAFKLNHPNLLHATYFDVLDKRPYLVMPYCPVSSEELVGKMTENEAWKFIKDVCAGLEYLHSKDVLHRDIKPDNILMDEQGDFLISDFGISMKMRNTLRRNSMKELPSSGASGTVGYMGPEMFTSSAMAVMATDIWALGATLFELLEGELPFFGQGGVMLLHGGEVPEMKGSWSDSLKSTVNACLSRDTWERPKAEELEEYSISKLAGKKVEAPWEKRWRELKKAETERARLEKERQKKMEEEKAEAARIKAEEDKKLEKQKAKEERELERQRKREAADATKEAKALVKEKEASEKAAIKSAKKAEREAAKSEGKKRGNPGIWVAAVAVVIALFVWHPWNTNDDQPVLSPAPSTEVIEDPISDSPEIVQETPEEKVVEQVNQEVENKKKEQERLAKERKAKEEAAKKEATEKAAMEIAAAEKAAAAAKASAANPLETALKNNNWGVVKQLADSGNTDACYEYAKHIFNSDYDQAHRYAIKAGRAKGTSIVVQLRSLGYYDDVDDPGWK